MKAIPREQFIDQLTHNWQPFVGNFQHLSPQDQIGFLQKQGYARFGDLLAHIIAWWQDGVQAIRQMQQDPTLPLADYAVDEFNARAVRQFEGKDEATVIRDFETQCQAMLKLVNSLPEQQLYQENINTRLYYEIIMHWTEHSIA